DQIAERLKMTPAELSAVPIAYLQFQIPKRSKGLRKILAPIPQLKCVQRQILRRVLGGLKIHPSATGFCRGHSIVSNALPHVGKSAIVRVDLKDSFPSTPAMRSKLAFEAIGSSTEAAAVRREPCAH